MEDVRHRIAAIEQDSEHGATFLTVEAISVLSAAASACPSGSKWVPSVTQVAERLAAAKPSMAGLRNAVYRLLGQMLELGPTSARRMAGALAEGLVAELRASSECAARNAARRLPVKTTVATCSYSSAVIRVFKMAQEFGKEVRALVFEPYTEEGSPGHRLAAELVSQGTEARLLDNPVAPEGVPAAQAALIGADAVTPGFVVNGTPSLALAQTVRGRIPLYVVCETIKFTHDVGVAAGYDRVPLNLVTGLVTEEGLLTPKDVRRRISTILRQFMPD